MALRNFKIFIFAIVIVTTTLCNNFELPTKGNDIYSLFPKNQRIAPERLLKFERIIITEKFNFIWILFQGDIDIPQEHVIILDKKMKLLGAKSLSSEAVYKVSGDTIYCYGQSTEILAKQRFLRDDLPKSVVINSDSARKSKSNLRVQDIMVDECFYNEETNWLTMHARKVNSDYYDGAKLECLEESPKSDWFYMKFKIDDLFFHYKNRSLYFFDSLGNERHIYVCDSIQIVSLRKQIIGYLGAESDRL